MRNKRKKIGWTGKRTIPRTAFKKGNPGGPGRPKGVPNKITTDLKQMILNALVRAGGENYFHTASKKNSRSFLQLLGRLLPATVKVGGDGPGGSIPVEVVQKVQGNLAALTEKELEQFQTLMKKVGL